MYDDDDGVDVEEEEGVDSRVLSVRLPRGGVARLLKAFAAADAKGTESACWWFARQGSDAQKPLVVAALVTDHQVTDGGIVDVSSGITQLTEFLVSRPDLTLVGWCLSCPRTRTASPTAADVQRTWALQRQYGLKSAFLLGLLWRGGCGEQISGVRAKRLRNEQLQLLQELAGRIDTNLHDVAEFFEDVPVEVFEEARSPLEVVHKGAWKCVTPRGARSASAAPASRPLVATVCGQVGQDLLRALRAWRVEGGDTDFAINEWIFNYTPPGGLQTTARLHELVKEAIKVLRQERVVEAKKPRKGSLVTEWKVKLIG